MKFYVQSAQEVERRDIFARWLNVTIHPIIYHNAFLELLQLWEFYKPPKL